MNPFSIKKYEKLIKLLKHSKEPFELDESSVKFRLLASMHTLDQKPRHAVAGYGWRIFKYSFGFVGLVLVVSTTFAFASTATPGQPLFALNKFGEQLVLSLPISAQDKAAVQAHIVENRLKALEQVQTSVSKDELATVKESDDSLNQAVTQITKNKQAAEKSGNKKGAQQLNNILNNIQNLAAKHEVQLQKLEDETSDQNLKSQIDQHLQKIKESRHKAELETNINSGSDTKSDD